MAKRQKTKVFSIKGFDAAHYKATDAYSRAVDNLFDRATNDVASGVAKLNVDENKPFQFSDYPSAQATMKRVANKLAKNITAVISDGSRKQWLFACKKNDEFVASIVDTSKLSKAQVKKMQDRNLDSLQTFQQRKVDGMNLSQRVWKYTEQFKRQIELGIDVGLGEGRSAQQLSRDLRQNLKDPNRLFRRVRDKRGNLHLSKNAKAFHPGIGVYRSSAKNAARLARSEINMAYRESDWLRWQQMDFVIGFEVHRSNHEPLCKCELCAKLVGRYPKWFKFKGWHPQCMCYCTPIMEDYYSKSRDDDRVNRLKAALRGEEYKKYTSPETISDVPDNFKNWVSENMDKQGGWGSTPYFIKDNFIDGKLSGGLRTPIKPMQNETPVKPITPKIDPIQEELKLFVTDSTETIKQAKRNSVDSSDLASVLVKIQADNSVWIIGKTTFKQMLSRIKQAISNVSTHKASINMPDELKSGSKYLKGENYTFDKEFFDLVDASDPIKLVLSKAKKTSFYSPSEKAVHLFDNERNAKSIWHAKSIVYHEFGHGIDWQRHLRQSKEVADMRNEQIKRLKKQGIYNVWSRRYDYAERKYVNEKTTRKMSLVAYIDHRLQELTSKVFGMKNETFTNRGITQMDVIEQIGATRDTIKSLVIGYGYGHSTNYFKRIGASEAEYLAHAFENAFIGNSVFKKYMPDIYNEMVSFIRSLK